MDNKKIRIQKMLSECGIASRRKAEKMVADGLVTINGTKAKIGDQVDIQKDKIQVNGQIVSKSKKSYYLMLNKPRGYISTTNDEMGRKCVIDLISSKIPEKVYPIGRLDKDSEGLLLLTNDGEFANSIIHPSNHIEKKYRVTTHPSITEDQLTKLSIGIDIDGRRATAHKIDVIVSEKDRSVLEITLKEGRNRQIRKMCEAVGLKVARLKRISIGQVKLGMLKIGDFRELTFEEIKKLKNKNQRNTAPETKL